jgi:photosystem II stability/assembly factor-like uncharacterized protein
MATLKNYVGILIIAIIPLLLISARAGEKISDQNVKTMDSVYLTNHSPTYGLYEGERHHRIRKHRGMHRSENEYSLSKSALGSWESLGPEGGWIENIVIDPINHDILYAQTYTYPCQIYKSVNGGNSWTQMSSISDYISSMAIDPNDPQILFVASGSYIYKSVNGGLNWQSSRISTEFYPYLTDIYISPANSNLVICGGHEWRYEGYVSFSSMSLYKSIDGGVTWTRYQASPENTLRYYAYAMVVNNDNTDEIFIGGYYYDGYMYLPKLLRSTDGGINWIDKTGTIEGYIYSLALDQTNPDKIYAGSYRGIFRSSNKGDSWLKNEGYAYAYNLAIDPVNTSIIYAGYGPNFFKSTDSGVHWTGNNSGVYGDCFSLLADHTVSGTLYFGTIAGIFKSTDQGDNWTEKNTGILAARVPAIGIAPSDPSIIYLEFNNNAIFKTEDSGNEWTRLPVFSACGNINSLSVDPRSPNIVYAFEGAG